MYICTSVITIIYNGSLSWHIRPGTVAPLFLISHYLDFEAGGRSLFIIDYAEVISSLELFILATENHKRNTAFQNHVQIRG